MKAKKPTLEDRILKLHDEIDALIAEKVAKAAREAPGVPSGVLEQCLTGRAHGCRCAAARLLLGKHES